VAKADGDAPGMMRLWTKVGQLPSTPPEAALAGTTAGRD